MTNDDARDLLLAAGVAESDIDDNALAVARVVGGMVIEHVTEVIARRIVEEVMSA